MVGSWYVQAGKYVKSLGKLSLASELSKRDTFRCVQSSFAIYKCVIAPMSFSPFDL